MEHTQIWQMVVSWDFFERRSTLALQQRSQLKKPSAFRSAMVFHLVV
jgi:hypothetical protein